MSFYDFNFLNNYTKLIFSESINNEKICLYDFLMKLNSYDDINGGNKIDIDKKILNVLILKDFDVNLTNFKYNKAKYIKTKSDYNLYFILKNNSIHYVGITTKNKERYYNHKAFDKLYEDINKILEEKHKEILIEYKLSKNKILSKKLDDKKTKEKIKNLKESTKNQIDEKFKIIKNNHKLYHLRFNFNDDKYLYLIETLLLSKYKFPLNTQLSTGEIKMEGCLLNRLN